MPLNVAEPFEVKSLDVAEKQQQQAVVWAKILPFVLFIWALTGAFYPAVDLCAGEKERGTLETLLSSPALRSEIVWGKLLTVMTFSVRHGAVESDEPGRHGQYVMMQLSSLTSSDTMSSARIARRCPWSACLLLALVPMSALFSAFCLACAAFARSTKEGQYYLMPLLLVTMPLMMLPMSPGMELNLGNSLIPITGVVLLLLRTLVEGNYADALPYIAPVVARRSSAACWRFAGPSINSTRSRCCFAKASGSTSAAGSSTWSAIGKTRRRWPKRFSAWR